MSAIQNKRGMFYNKKKREREKGRRILSAFTLGSSHLEI